MTRRPGAREWLSSARHHQRIRGDTFDRLDLSLAALDRLWLDRCTFAGTDLRHATLDGCHFKFCTFIGANLRGASLRSATFAGCDMRDTDLQDCDLTGARFGWVNSGSANAFTDVTGALWSPHGLNHATFDRVVGAPD